MHAGTVGPKNGANKHSAHILMPPPGRRGTRRDAAAGEEETRDAGEEETRDSGARKYIAVEDLAPLLISGLPQRGTRSSGATKPTAAGDVARLLGEVAKKS